MRNTIYVCEFAGNNLLNESFDIREDAAEWAESHKAEGPTVKAVDVEFGDDGSETVHGEEVILSIEPEACGCHEAECGAAACIRPARRAPRRVCRKADPEAFCFGEGEYIADPFGTDFGGCEPMEVCHDDHRADCAADFCQGPADFLRELAAELGIADEVEISEISDEAKDPEGIVPEEVKANEEPNVEVKVEDEEPAKEISDCHVCPKCGKEICEDIGCRVADVEYNDDDNEDVHALIKVKLGDTEETISDALYEKGFIQVYVNDIYDYPHSCKQGYYDVVEVFDESVCPKCGKKICEEADASAYDAEDREEDRWDGICDGLKGILGYEITIFPGEDRLFIEGSDGKVYERGDRLEWESRRVFRYNFSRKTLEDVYGEGAIKEHEGSLEDLIDIDELESSVGIDEALDYISDEIYAMADVDKRMEYSTDSCSEIIDITLRGEQRLEALSRRGVKAIEERPIGRKTCPKCGKEICECGAAKLEEDIDHKELAVYLKLCNKYFVPKPTFEFFEFRNGEAVKVYSTDSRRKADWYISHYRPMFEFLVGTTNGGKHVVDLISWSPDKLRALPVGTEIPLPQEYDDAANRVLGPNPVMTHESDRCDGIAKKIVAAGKADAFLAGEIGEEELLRELGEEPLKENKALTDFVQGEMAKGRTAEKVAKTAEFRKLAKAEGRKDLKKLGEGLDFSRLPSSVEYDDLDVPAAAEFGGNPIPDGRSGGDGVSYSPEIDARGVWNRYEFEGPLGEEEGVEGLVKRFLGRDSLTQADIDSIKIGDFVDFAKDELRSAAEAEAAERIATGDFDEGDIDWDIGESLSEAAQPEIDLEKIGEDRRKMATAYHKPVIYGYMGSDHHGNKRYFEIDPIVCDDLQKCTKQVMAKYHPSGSVLVAYPNTDEALCEDGEMSDLELAERLEAAKKIKRAEKRSRLRESEDSDIKWDLPPAEELKAALDEYDTYELGTYYDDNATDSDYYGYTTYAIVKLDDKYCLERRDYDLDGDDIYEDLDEFSTFEELYNYIS